MAINLELPRKLNAVIEKAHQGAAEMLRPISRKWDLREHEYPVELDTLATLFEGISEANTIAFAGAEAFRDGEDAKETNHNGGNMSAVLNVMEISWGDVALMLSVPRQGLGNAAISGVATDEQLERLGNGVWAAMAITEPGFGSYSAAVSTTAKLDGDEYVINGEKIYVTAGSRASHIVVWATLDKSLGRAAIKSFIVPREHPGVTVERLEELRKVLEGAGVEISYDKPAHAQSAAAAEFLRMEADWEAGYLLMVRSAWQADNNIPNSKEASMGKAKAGRVASDITLKAVEIAGTTGYSEQTLLEKWARDSKILDIFEGTQQIQQLVVARRLLGLSSTELK